MASPSVPDILPEIKQWLGSNWQKITQFWLYADWRMWARYDLYAHLESSVHKSQVRHGVQLWGDDITQDVDITVGPADSQKDPVAIWICAQRTGENDTSFPNFSKKFQQEWALVQDLTKKNGGGDYDNGKLLFLGIGEKAWDDDLFQFGGLKPAFFGFGGTTQYEGSCHAYYKWLDLPPAKE